MTVKLNVQPLAEVFPLLPKEAQDAVPKKLAVFQLACEDYYDLEGIEKSKNYYPIMIGVGVTIALGAAFFLLAQYQVLPSGVNAISRVGGGFGLLSIGAVITVAGGVKTYLIYRRNANIDRLHERMLAQKEWCEIDQISTYFSQHPPYANGEYIAIEVPLAREVRIFGTLYDATKKAYYPSSFRFSYRDSTTNEAWETWSRSDVGKYHMAKFENGTQIDIAKLKEYAVAKA